MRARNKTVLMKTDNFILQICNVYSKEDTMKKKIIPSNNMK